MNMLYTHKPNYYFFAHKFVLFLESYLKSHPTEQQTSFNLQTIYDLFSHDRASSTTNLEGILNIADEYVLETDEGQQSLIQSYHVHLDNHVLTLAFNTKAVESLKAGQTIVSPQAA
ncbi:MULTISPECIES: hypothetical protein [Acinetobacter]|uniref:Uncharacterized protein n=1 Tax=Acinetobacter dispersus TaxID=70348 RepID=N9MGP7_9GAMM|nr:MULTISPECIES: hypothetical protein [Acinetobacter]ENW92435.1 hypothetical protein F904_02375 [Acinetobacter dispersus]ENX43306.1 hypothetical protein F887_01479 [Acinetobacter sp. NIPH 2100]ENX52852.1 hypothetical protein F901_02584 [Acinetobacter dispersus]MCH7313396.1 hypothetical protein [Acinetobacter sp. ANC 3882]MCH7383498.1 hypothetical protein [Acinetobacter dispersus]